MSLDLHLVPGVTDGCHEGIESLDEIDQWTCTHHYNHRGLTIHMAAFVDMEVCAMWHEWDCCYTIPREVSTDWPTVLSYIKTEFRLPTAKEVAESVVGLRTILSDLETVHG